MVPVPESFALKDCGDSLSKRILFGGKEPGPQMSGYINRWVDEYIAEVGYGDEGIIDFFLRQPDWYRRLWTT